MNDTAPTNQRSDTPTASASRPGRRPRAAFLSGLGVMCLLAVLCLPQIGLARKLAANTIDHDATLSAEGKRIVLTGPFRCTQEEWVDLRVTITQRTTGAIAEGHVRLRGSTTEQHWEVVANTRGSAEFEEGTATAVAVAVTTREGDATDAHQWLVPIELSAE